MAMSFWEQIAYYRDHGCCPLPTAHHPKEIREALRVASIRPMMKECFRNSQRFIIGAGLGDRLIYVEGTTGDFGNHHAWLLFDGKILDLTLDEETHDYHPELTATVKEVARHFLSQNGYCPMGMIVHSELDPPVISQYVDPSGKCYETRAFKQSFKRCIAKN